jgi:hypothetical protein
MRVATRRRDTFGARLEHLDGVTAIELARCLGDRHANEFTRQRVTHEGDPTIIRATDGTARRGSIHANR